MSKRIKRQAGMLRFLKKTNPVTANAIIKTSNTDLLNSLCECTLNILNGVVPLSPKQRHRLVKYKQHMRRLITKSVSRQKKKALLQKGGFLSALLAPIIGILTNILGG